MNGRLLQVGVIVAVSLVLAPRTQRAAAPEDDPERTAAKMITPETDLAVENGLKWLASRQHDDGSFGSVSYRGNVAVTSLVGLAMMAGGSTPGRGPYGKHVSRCLDYVLDNVQESGFIIAPGSESHGPMYGHGFATLFLAECYGSSPRAELREKLSRAVELIVNTQNEQGGWRYKPQRDAADLSVTICQVMALRAARNAGLFVPNKTIDACIEYVKASQNADGGFMYMLQGGESEFPRSAAGIVALYSAGIYQGDEISKGLSYLMGFLPKRGEIRRREGYYFYGHYYAAQAMWHAGGKHWNQWYPAIRDVLIDKQEDDGSWPSARCLEYSTAMACIILQLPNNTLPSFPR